MTTVDSYPVRSKPRVTRNVRAIAVASEGTILTSMLKRVDVAVFEAIKAFTEGSLESGVQVFDLANDGIGYATSGDFLSEDIINQLDELKTKIVDGEIEVPTAP